MFMVSRFNREGDILAMEAPRTLLGQDTSADNERSQFYAAGTFDCPEPCLHWNFSAARAVR